LTVEQRSFDDQIAEDVCVEDAADRQGDDSAIEQLNVDRVTNGNALAIRLVDGVQDAGGVEVGKASFKEGQLQHSLRIDRGDCKHPSVVELAVLFNPNLSCRQSKSIADTGSLDVGRNRRRKPQLSVCLLL